MKINIDELNRTMKLLMGTAATTNDQKTKEHPMSEQINPSDGWRLLGPDEVVKDGDEPWHRFERRWMQIPMDVPYTAKAYPAVRRRIPTKPEAMEIEAERGRLRLEIGTTGNAWIGQDLGPYAKEVKLDTTEQIRQVITWLQQVANWREAQNDN